MKKRNKLAAWAVAMAVIGVLGFIAVQAFGQVTLLRRRGTEACRAHFELTTGSAVDPSDIKFTHLKTVFPEPLDKRFRARCDYGGTSVVIESKPLGEWAVIGAEALD
jgi:hypothetical protein